MIKKRNNFTLLEVLIGFLIVLIALVPLFSPYVYMQKREQAIVQELEMDRLASLYFVELLEKILKKEIHPTNMQGGEVIAIEAKLALPYAPHYVFQQDEVTIVFTPLKGGLPFLFNYTLRGYEN